MQSNPTTNFDNCPVCGGAREFCFEEKLLGKHSVAYGLCAECGLLQTEEPYWLDEAYDDAIAVTDTGLVQRNISLASKLATALYFILGVDGKCLDIAGGYGMLVRLMRDFGFDFFWDDKYCTNILAKGFEAGQEHGDFEVLTAFEVMEHVYDPVSFVQEALDKYGAKTLIFSTQLYSGKNPPATDWWYYSFDTGQHISFYTDETLRRIAVKLGLNFYSAGGLHLLTDKPIKTLLLPLLKGKLSLPLSLYVRWRKGTKVMDDHYEMVDKLRSLTFEK